MIGSLIIMVLYIAALPFVIIMFPKLKEMIGWESNIFGFVSVWLIMPLFLITKFIKSLL